MPPDIPNTRAARQVEVRLPSGCVDSGAQLSASDTEGGVKGGLGLYVARWTSVDRPTYNPEYKCRVVA